MAPSRISLFNGVYSFGDDIYMALYSLGEPVVESRFTCMKYDQTTQGIPHSINYPGIYDKAHRGGTLTRDHDFHKIGETFLGGNYASIAIPTPDGVLVPYLSYKDDLDAPFSCHIFTLSKK